MTVSLIELAHRFLFPALWASWAIYWWLSSRAVKTTVRHEPLGSRLLHVVPLLLALPLMLPDELPGRFLQDRLFPWTPWEFWPAAAVTASGLAFAVWARLHLGRNWSGTVTIKQDHELIDTGPYAIVRHPIYTGLLIAFIGSAWARDEWRGVPAVVLAWLAIWRKLRFEERWMLEIFGERYADYRRRVPALIPFLRTK